MATTLNLGNIKGDQGIQGETGLTPVITANTGANVPVDTQGTATADTTDPDNPIITFGLPIGATGATPVITASATALANGETPTATADTTDPANPSIAFGIPAGDQGIQGETGAQGPAGAATGFVVDLTGTFAVNYVSSGMGNFDTYQLANGGVAGDPQGGMFKFYTSTVIVDAGLASAGANDFNLGTLGTMFFRRKDTNNVDMGDYLDNLTANGGNFSFVDSANRTAVWAIDTAGTAITYDPVAPANLYTAFRVNQVSLDAGFDASTATGAPLTLTGIATSGTPFQTYTPGSFSFLDNTPRTLWWRSGNEYTTSGLFTDVPGQGNGWTEI